MRSYAFEKKNFKNSPHMHDWAVKDIAKHYRICNKAVVNVLFPVIGRKTKRQQENERKEKVINHPMFGKKGERAPCKNKDFADMVDASNEWVGKLRKKAGVKPFNKLYDFTGCRTPGLYRGRGGKKAGPYIPTKAEERVYNLVKICNNWGRPEGIDEHLEEINVRM